MRINEREIMMIKLLYYFALSIIYLQAITCARLRVETAAGAHRPTSRTPGKQCHPAGGVFSPSRDLGFYELLPKLKEPVNCVG